MTIKAEIALLKDTFNKWSDHHAPRLGASVAFYTLLSFAPLLVLIVALLGLFLAKDAAQSGIIDQAKQMIGDRGADTVKSLLLSNAQKEASGWFASIIAFITLLFGASGVFGELRDALNTVWDATPKNESGVMGMIKERLFSFGMVLSVGFVLLVSLLISAGLAVIGKFFGNVVPLPAPVFQAINFVVSFAIITLLFGLMFKFVPAVQISWRNVAVGAVGTALLFTIGKLLLGLYLGKASVGSAYGAAGSLVAVIVWVYYSAQIFFFGAEFTRVYADAHGRAAPEPVPQVAPEKPPQARPAEEPGPAGVKASEPVAARQAIRESLAQLEAEAVAAATKIQRAPAAVAPPQIVQRTLVPPPARRTVGKKPPPWLLGAAAIGFLIGRASVKSRS